MRREILFRGKRKDNGEWVEGSYLPPVGGYPPNVCTEHAIRVVGRAGLFKWYEIIPETLGQYTGLKDKNAVKVFEGDIILFDYANIYKDLKGVVSLNDYFHSCIKANVHGMGTEFHIELAVKGRVIGNVYNDPELLGRE